MSKTKIVIAAIIWLILIGSAVAVWRLWMQPTLNKAEQRKQEEREKELQKDTKGSSQYDHQLKLALDGFSGYAVLRSEAFAERLRQKRIRIEMIDDQANYTERLESLAVGKAQFAAFPLDSLIKASAAANKLPATAIAVIDESQGADAMLAYRDKYPNIDAIEKNPLTKIVLVGDSPSETLARVVLNDFGMRESATEKIVSVGDADSLKKRYQAAVPGGDEVFVTWEPLVSEMLNNDQLHVLVDSSRFSGYVVDCLVVSRDFASKNEEVMRDVLESYFAALYEFREDQAMSELLIQDSKSSTTGAIGLTAAQSQKLLKQIAWRNTQENYVHFGLRNETKLSNIEDMSKKIVRVLLATGALKSDPLEGDYTKIFFEKPLSQLRDKGFNPGISEEQIRGNAPLPSLSEAQWDTLIAVGTLSVPPLVFGRGTSKLTEQSQQTLDELIEQLNSWPQYYLLIRGNASTRGNVEANKKLALERAVSALDYLKSHGVEGNRMRAVAGDLTGETSVQFVFGQTPF